MSARVAIAANYFPAYARIPRKAQRKADEFIRKFQHDPKQASIHYEPIGSTVDKQLRSVRVGDDYRAIVRAPEKGDLFILLYIDHHDEAYRWAEGKALQVHPSTGTLQFFDVDEASAAVTSLSSAPAEDEQQGTGYQERRLFSDFSDEQLFVGGVPKMLIPAVRALYTDADLDKLVEHLPREAADLLTGLASGYDYDAVLEAILDGDPAPASAGRTQRAVATEDIARVDPIQTVVDISDIESSLQKESSQAQFRILDEDFDLDKALAHPLDVWRVYLHPSQKKIVRSRTKGPLRVTGGAGTGKTVVAMHRAAWLLKRVFTAPDDKILVTTFTRNLAHDIRHNLEKLLEPEDGARVEVTNIDAWAAEYLRAQGQVLRPATRKHQDEAWTSAFDLYGVDGYDLHFCKAEWDAVIQAQDIEDEAGYVRAVRHHRGVPVARADRRKLWEMFSEYRNALNESGVAENIDIIRAARKRLEEQAAAPQYRSVIVDETQDLSNESLRLIRVIAGPERADDLFLVGDAHQRIYGRPAPLSQCGINIRGRRSRELRLNYRTTAAICRWSLKTLGTSDYDDLDGGKASTKGYVSLRKGASPVVRHFEHQAQERGFIIETIQKLLKSGLLPEEICLVARTTKHLTESYGPAFDQAGIDYEILEQKEPRSSSVRLATMHRVKGLEFPVMFVAAVNDGLLPLDTPDLRSDDPLVAAHAQRQERCLLYVATSRARDQLYVSSYNTKSPFLEGLNSDAELKLVPQTPVAEKRSPAPAPASPPPSAAFPIPTTEVQAGFAAIPVSSWHFPTRMANWLSKNGIETIADLIALKRGDLMKERNLGRKSVSETAALIRAKLGASWDELHAGHSSFETVQAVEQSAPVTADLAAVLEEPLQNLGLPVRFFTWANQHHVLTLRDLASRSPLELFQARNMGRGTVAEARRVVESKLGRRWEEVQRQLSTGAIVEVDPRWQSLAKEIPALIAARPLTEVPLPLVVREAAAHLGLSQVGALISFSEEALLKAPKLSRSVLAVASQGLRNFAAKATEQITLWEQGFLHVFKRKAQELPTIPRMIVTRRAGLGIPAETLEEIGSTLGVTRERIRQIEKKTWEDLQRDTGWCGYVKARCVNVTPDGAISLDALEDDPWWAELSEAPEALDYFCDRLLDGSYRVIQLEGQRFLASIEQKELDSARASARRIVKGLRLPSPVSQVHEAVASTLGAVGPYLRQVLWEEIEEELSVDGQGASARAIAFGSSQNAQVIAFLERQDRPVSVNDVIAEVGRSVMPDEVFLLARGMVGLERHFPDFQEWKRKVAPVAIRLIEENGPERQWSCKDLLPDLSEEMDLPDWLEHWHLAAILKRSEGIEYLGRLRVALPGVIEDSTRILSHEAMEQIMMHAGEPMDWDTLTQKLRAKLDVSDIALVGLLNRPPFLKVDKRVWGLLSRDLPGGVEAMSEALDELEAVLERRERGLSAKFVLKEISRLSAMHAQWSKEMCLTVVRGDPRFRITIAGNVGLAEWESVRVPSRMDIVQEALNKSGGRVSIQAVQDRIEALYEAPVSRIQLGLYANRFGSHLAGEWLEAN